MKVFIEERVNQLLFRERFEFARQLARLRREMANVVEIEELAEMMMTGLQDSRRITQASLYLLEDDGQSYLLISALGEAPAKMDAVQFRAFLEQLRVERAVVREDMQDQILELRQEDSDSDAVEELETIAASQRLLGAGVSVPMLSEDLVVGVLNVHDDRMREAYTVEEIHALVQIAGQAVISVENSRAVQALREKDRLAALGEMAAGLAHEIRNPLGAIKGAAQMLDLTLADLATQSAAQDDDEEESSQEFVSIIIEEVNRLNTVVSQFLDYARPYRGDASPCDLNLVLERAEALWRAEAERWGVRCRLELSPSLAEARADPEHLRQVFLNLALNAIQATGHPPPEEGEERWEEFTDAPAPSEPRERELVIKTSQVRRAIVLGGRSARRDMLEVRFTDNGRGISPEEMKRLFIPFFTTRRKGTGLGLAISQRIVENLGGRVEVNSTLGHGATFKVLIPLAEQRSLS